MTRGIGGFDLASGIPAVGTAVAGALTQLGDAWFLVVAAGALFVLGRRRRSVTAAPRRDATFLLALVVVAYAVTTVLKYAFGLPRPPGAGTTTPPSWVPALVHGVYESFVTADSYGFPSGHAVTTTVFYGGAAVVLDVWTRTRRLVAAGTVVVLVATSRVVLGVHYVVDVVAGVGVGVVVLAATLWLTDRSPTRALALSAGLAALSFAVSGSYEAGLGFVATVAGLVAWVAVGRSASPRTRAEQ
ncbi:phosphatase PAP2 family protein [Halorussus halobius]|uniref:phosphatase PAP2 family protein n=1 Tax=Halorussus halobius TaxID=1710537 RepID=UPI0010932E23|nr:phosphatase PAP2 family protein [Halorussus halobius]